MCWMKRFTVSIRCIQLISCHQGEPVGGQTSCGDLSHKNWRQREKGLGSVLQHISICDTQFERDNAARDLYVGMSAVTCILLIISRCITSLKLLPAASHLPRIHP
jgi:hypothetical protein